MELKVYNIKGEETGRQVKLTDEIFGIEPNDHAIYLDVKQYMANNRQGTHKSKERGEIAGSTRKLKKQKGTGSARFGSIKNPLFRGGGRIFGPRPRDYSFKLNKKLKQLARKSALTYKAKSEGVFVIEDFNFEAPKTKQYREIINNLKIGDKKSLLVLAESNKNIYLSSRNLQGSKTVTVSELTTYDIMDAKILIFAESSIDALQKTF
jgi:large subunit ribosomal protein L4